MGTQNRLSVARCCCEEESTCTCCSGSTEPDEVQVEISGITNSGCSDCASQFNGTFILPFVWAGPSYCDWLYRFDPWLCCQFSANNSTTLQARTQQDDDGNCKWIVELAIACYDPYTGSYTVLSAQWKWDSGGSSDFDCSVARTLTFDADDSSDETHCSYGSSSVTLTPQ